MYFLFSGAREWGHPSPAWRYLTFTLNFGLDLRKYGTFSHAWSLCVEEQFYFVLPLIFLLFGYFRVGNKAIYLLLALFVGGFLIRLWSWQHFIVPTLSKDSYGALWNEYIYYPTYNRLDSLLIGVSIAGLYTFYPKIKAWVNANSYRVLFAGIILLVISGFVCKGYATYNTAIWGFPLVGLSYGLILAAVVCPSNFAYRFRSFVTTWLATLSYAIYLSHKIVIHITQNWVSGLGLARDSNLMMLICILAVVTAALIMHYIIEKPALALRNKILSRLKI